MSSDKHERAIDLTEQALDKMVEGDDETATRLINEAKKLDRTAPEEILRDMEEDAATRRIH